MRIDVNFALNRHLDGLLVGLGFVAVKKVWIYVSLHRRLRRPRDRRQRTVDKVGVDVDLAICAVIALLLDEFGIQMNLRAFFRSKIGIYVNPIRVSRHF